MESARKRDADFDDASSAGGLSGVSSYQGPNTESSNLLEGTAAGPKIAAAGAAGAAAGAAAVAALGSVPEEDVDDGTFIGLGIQLQEPGADGSGAAAGGGFIVTRLIRGSPGDKCGLIMEGDSLVSVDGRSIAALRFSEVSALLSGPEGVPVSLSFERQTPGVGGGEGRLRTYDVALRRERFLLPDEDGEDDEFADEDDDASMISESGGLRRRKADYWEGYRAAMSHKAPPFATSIASFETDDDAEDDDDKMSDAPSLPALPHSPSGSDLSDDPTEVEATTEQQLSGALAAGATVGLPTPASLQPLPTAAEINAREAAEAAAEREAIAGLSQSARQWAERMGQWDATLRRDLEGMAVKSELLDMWRLKLTRVRAKLGVEEKAVAAQEAAIAAANIPPPREAEGAKATAEVLRMVREGGKESTAELLTELQRQMVEAERWRAETKRMAYQLKRDRDEVGKRSKEMGHMRAQTVHWSADNKSRREQVEHAKREADEMRKQNAAVVAQASTLEERVAKLQDEVTLKSELAAMWRRSAERGAGGSGGGASSEAEAAALTWKLEAEKAMREGERWKALARRSEDAVRQKEEDVLMMRVQLEEVRTSLEKRQQVGAHRAADEAPLEEIKMALLSAQDDLQSKADEAAALSSKVSRLEQALRQIM